MYESPDLEAELLKAVDGPWHPVDDAFCFIGWKVRGLLPHHHRQSLLKRGEDAVVSGIDFGGFEGFVGGAVGEGPGEGFAVGGELGAGGVGEDVEEGGADEQGLFDAVEEGGDFGVRHVGGELEGDVAAHAGEAGEVGELGGAGAALAQGAEEEFADIDRLACIERTSTGRVELGDPAEDAVAGLQLAVEEEGAVVFEGLDFDGGDAGEVFDEAAQVEDVGGFRHAGMPGARRNRAAEQDGEALFFADHAVRHLEEDAADLEEAETISTLADVQRGAGEQAGDDARAEGGVVFAERVLQCREAAGGVAEGIVGLRRGDEAEGLSLVEASIRQGLADLHGVVVNFVGAITLREGGGELGRHAVESDDAGDFFDEIDAADEVEAVAGDGPGGAVLGQTELGEDGVGFFDLEAVDAEQAQGALFIENDVADELRGFTGDLEFGFGGAAGDFQNEFRGEIAAAVDLMRVDAALEAVAGVGMQRESAGGAADVARGEVGAFQKDVRGAFDDAGFLTAHDASDGDGAGVVGDDEVFGEKGVFLAVEREDLFAFLGAADGDAALEFIEVKGVQALAHLHHHIVGDIDDVVDGAEADAFEAGFQPSWAGADFDAFDDAGGVVGAAVGGLERDFVGRGDAGL